MVVKTTSLASLGFDLFGEKSDVLSFSQEIEKFAEVY